MCYNPQHFPSERLARTAGKFRQRKWPMTQKALQTRVSIETREAFKAAAEAHGTSESQFLRVIIERVLRIEGSTREATKEPPKGKRVQINVGLSSDEAARVVMVAKQAGLSRVEWIVKLIRAHLFKAPQFGPTEVEALMDSNRQLAAVGRNLNQIAKTLNLDPNASYQVTVEAIQALADQIKQHRRTVAGLLDSNLNRWGAGRE